jgi:hypothetical protein
MFALSPELVVAGVTSLVLLLALSAALILVIVARRRRADIALAVATGLVVVGLVSVVVLPVEIPLVVGLPLALLGTALAVAGGDPLTRRVLDLATHGQVRDGDAGGILVFRSRADDGSEPGLEEVLRGGTTIGYLERLAVVLSLLAGFPEAIAVVVAIKGIGRFSELATSAARERFIVGTLASLLWAGVIGALVRLAIF